MFGVEVTIGRAVPTGVLELIPVWKRPVIEKIRQFLKCTCEAHIRSGWVCSHVLATLGLLKLLDISAALSKVPVRRAPGRPRKRRPALTHDDTQDGYFSVSKLTALFVRRPGNPLHWKLVDTFDVDANGETEQSNFIGAVVGLRLSDGVYVWSVRFSDGDLRDYEAADLAVAVNMAHRLGVDVTGSVVV
jgi:hypothetical protein